MKSFNYNGSKFVVDSDIDVSIINGELFFNSQAQLPKVQKEVKHLEEPLADALGMNSEKYLDGVPRGALKNVIVPTYFKNIGDNYLVRAQSDKTVRAAFYAHGMAAGVYKTKKYGKRARGPFIFNVIREDFNNAYTAKKKSA